MCGIKIYSGNFKFTHSHNVIFLRVGTYDVFCGYRSLGSWMKRQGKSRGTGTAGEEMQTFFTKESEILTKNIGSEPLRRNNVVLSHENLRMIAILHESVVSVCGCVYRVKGGVVWAALQLAHIPVHV